MNPDAAPVPAMPPAPAPALALDQVADLVLGVESTSALLAAIEQILTDLMALPARLYLWDAHAGAYYAAAGFGCDRAAPDLSPAQAQAANRFPFATRGHPVGLLAIDSGWVFDRAPVEHLVALLGPLITGLHRQDQAAQALRAASEQVEQVISAGDLLSHLDVEVLLVKILETMLSATKAQVGAVLVPDEAGMPQVRVTWGFPEAVVRRVAYRDGLAVVDRVQRDGRMAALDADAVARDLDTAAIAPIRLTALLALPMSARGRTQGVLVLANPEDGFDQHRRRLASTLCGMAAIALDNALLVKATLDRERLAQEMGLARSVQTGMYPPGGLERHGIALLGASRPCSETGGDYYTYLERDGRLVAMIGDVSGHGLGAALFTTMAHAVIHQQLRDGVALVPAMRALNGSLVHSKSRRFMTAALVEIDPATRAFRYVSAGHNPLLWVHDGVPVWLDSTGMPLGIMAGAEFDPPPEQVASPGDWLVLYTDGYTEAATADGQVFGDDRLVAALRAATGPAEAIAALDAACDAFAGTTAHADDLTLVVIRFG